MAHTADVGVVAAHTLAHAKVSHLQEGPEGSTDALLMSRSPLCPCGVLRTEIAFLPTTGVVEYGMQQAARHKQGKVELSRTINVPR